MALLRRGLCAILLLWLAVTRPSVDPTESPYSAWRTARHTQEVKATAQRLRNAGDYAGLEQIYLSAIDYVRSRRIVPAEITYLTALANTYVFLYRYHEALKTYQAARDLAAAHGFWEMAGAVAPGMSSVYHEVGDDEAALEAIRQGLDAVQRSGVRPYYEAGLQLQLIRLSEAEPATIREAIAAANGDAFFEASGWDFLADRYLERGDLEAAQEAAAMSLRLRQSLASQNVQFTYWRLALIRLAQAERATGAERQALLDAAERYNRRASDLTEEVNQPLLRHQLGLIEQARGRTRAALEHFRAAVVSAGSRRSVTPLAASSLAASDRKFQEQVLNSFVEAAASQSLAEHDRDLARDSFLALEQYRCASLRHTRDLAPVWRNKLPARYWAALGELRAAEAAQIGSREPDERANRLRLEITEMEAHASIGLSLNQSENFLGQTSLILFQRGLSREELLLSFYLGKRRSYLWAVSREGMQLYELPPAGEIASRMEDFRNAVLGHRTELAKAAGEKLYRLLFGQLNRTELGKESWLLSLEGILFELPFAALRVADAAAGGGEPEFLVQRHSLQVVPGALLLGKRSGAPGDRYLAVGDPIYNAADPRYRGERRAGASLLNRLVASGDEIRRSVAAWGAGHDGAVILSGADASRRRIAEAVSQGSLSTVHLSTHVVQNATHRDRAYLALSLSSDGTLELLGAADIALLHVPGSLVVMTGCASGTGEIVPGAGLLGLTRGWLVAGAASVLATSWPIPDAGGDVIPNFFRYVREASPAAALRRSQIEAIGSATWQADPAYWASFQVTGGAR